MSSRNRGLADPGGYPARSHVSGTALARISHNFFTTGPEGTEMRKEEKVGNTNNR